MQTIKLNDSCFTGDRSSSKYHAPQFFEWDRTGGFGEVVFFTDDCFEMATMECYRTSYRIAWLIEPPAIRPDIYQLIRKNYSRFDLVLTHQLNFIGEIPNSAWYPSHMSWISKEDSRRYDKSKGISMIASDKCYTEGHQLRHSVIRSYEIPPFDVFGSCNGNILKQKIEGLKDYRFSICIENSREDGYYTEKLIDSFSTYTIPIYWGCPNIGDYFDCGGMVICRSLRELQEAIMHVASNLEATFESHRPFLEENFRRATQYHSPEDYIFQNVLLPRKIMRD